jgi:hypothetical protein
MSVEGYKAYLYRLMTEGNTVGVVFELLDHIERLSERVEQFEKIHRDHANSKTEHDRQEPHYKEHRG